MNAKTTYFILIQSTDSRAHRMHRRETLKGAMSLAKKLAQRESTREVVIDSLRYDDEGTTNLSTIIVF